MSEEHPDYRDEQPGTGREAKRQTRWRAGIVPAVIGASAGMVVALATTMSLGTSLGSGKPALSEVAVTFDTARYVNARRMAAGSMLGEDAEKEKTASTLARADRNVKSVLQEKADGRIVLVRQAVVMEEQLPDLTEDVLTELGLPTEAPTVGIDREVAADTDFRHSETYEQARENVEERNENTREGIGDDKDLDEWLP